MTLLEKLAEAKDQLVEIKAAVESGEKSADDLSEAIANVKAAQADVDAADEAEEMIKAMGSPIEEKAETEESKMEYRTLGEFAEANLDLSDMLAGKAKSAGTNYGFKAQTDAHIAPQIVTVDNAVVDLADQLTLRGLCSILPKMITA